MSLCDYGNTWTTLEVWNSALIGLVLSQIIAKLVRDNSFEKIKYKTKNIKKGMKILGFDRKDRISFIKLLSYPNIC